MKSKLKIIIPTGIALIAISLAFIRFAPTKAVDIGTMISTAQQYLTEQKYEQAIAEFCNGKLSKETDIWLSYKEDYYVYSGKNIY